MKRIAVATTRGLLYVALPACLLAILWVTRCGGLLYGGWTDVAAREQPTPASVDLFRMTSADPKASKLYTGAKFEPAYGCYIGAYVEADGMLLGQRDAGGNPLPPEDAFGALIGKPLATVFTYLNYGHPFPVDWARKLCSKGMAAQLAVEPNKGLKAIQNDEYLRQFARDAASVGGPVFLRFASEMNGPWMPYHGDPKLYREKFRLVHDVMARLAPNVAMVWCAFQEPIDEIDSYYPGDDCVDWVGINVYSVTYHNNSRAQAADWEIPAQLIRALYLKYAPRKPIAICEFGATHLSAVDGHPRPDFAAEKISQFYASLPTFLRRIKMIVYFDANNFRFAPAGRKWNDYSVTNDPLVLAAMRQAVAPEYFLSVVPPSEGKASAYPRRLQDGARLSGQIELHARPAADRTAAAVAYFVDSQPVATVRQAPYSARIDLTPFAPGAHTLGVTVGDDAGAVVAQRQYAIELAAPGKMVVERRSAQ